ncbi:sorting nexin-21 isoform X3 [Callithrix jacchus]
MHRGTQEGAMASRLLYRLRHAFAGDSPGEAAAARPEAEQFPESSELEDDDAEGLSSRLSGTLSFTSAEDDEDDEDEDDEETGPDPLPPGDGTSGEDAERSPPPDGQRGSQLLARQLQDFWKKSRNTLAPQRLLFEVTSATVVKDPPSKQTSGKMGLGSPATVATAPALLGAVPGVKGTALHPRRDRPRASRSPASPDLSPLLGL